MSMIFITGGAAQGKRTFAREKLGINVFSDGAAAQYEELFGAVCITDYQLLVRRLMNEGTDPAAFTERLCAEGKLSAVIMNEVGCGIVPIEKDERLWRENCGRCGCILAEKADAVIRMVCGIPTVIKGELP